MKLKQKQVNKQTTYKIPVSWVMYAEIVVDAASLDEAIDKVRNGPLPDRGEYIPETFIVCATVYDDEFNINA